MDGLDGGEAVLWTSPLEAQWEQLDTLIWLSGLDTETYGWRFSIHMYNEEVPIGSPPPATTPRLSLTPDDNRLELNVLQGVPWQVNEYVFEREQSEGEGWIVLDTLGLPMFVDTGLVNGSTYCYRVTTIGSYDDPTTESPLLNGAKSLAVDHLITRRLAMFTLRSMHTVIWNETPCDGHCHWIVLRMMWLDSNLLGAISWGLTSALEGIQ